MKPAEIVVTNAGGVVYDPYVSPSARAREARSRNGIALVTQDHNPSIGLAADENERIARDETAIGNLRAAKQAGESTDAWYDPYDPWESE